MPKPTGPTNPLMQKLIAELRARGHREQRAFLLELAEQLGRPARRRAEVNLSSLNRNAAQNETVVVPGKVLAAGSINKPVTVAAALISAAAAAKIEAAGGKVLSIPELVKSNPQGTGVRILV